LAATVQLSGIIGNAGQLGLIEVVQLQKGRVRAARAGPRDHSPQPRQGTEAEAPEGSTDTLTGALAA
jgi:hypothetical protein